MGDAVAWLEDLAHHEHKLGAVVTSLPDAAEVDLSLGAWELWFEAAVDRCFDASAGPSVFIQTDRKVDGQWISKPLLIGRGCRQTLLWHRIQLRRDPGKQDLQRPTYTHILAYGPGTPGGNHPDVLPVSKSLWTNGTPIHAAVLAVAWCREQGAKAIVNPFSGQGTILAVANGLGLDAYGCELDEQRALKSEQIKLDVKRK